jgi:hypothetical protein
MEFNVDICEYLVGNKFSNGLLVPISVRESGYLDRLTILEIRVRHKNVIHLGCVDHLPLIQQKLSNDMWLHARLCRSAKRCLGVDINCEGIDYLRNELGYSDLICANFLLDAVPQIEAEQWDFMILGEILEHVDNPVALLTAINQKYAKYVNRLIITVPNAFAWLNFRYVLKHKEFINSDHRYWFTPYTLGKVVTNAGMTVINFQFCEGTPIDNLNWKGKLKRFFDLYHLIKKLIPGFRETLVMEVGL